MEKSDYLTVSLLTQYLQRKFDFDPYLQKVYLVGEISNFRLRPNSHQYFSLKDDHAKISAVMFANAFNKLKFKPEEGMKVFVTGRITLYGPSGNYQINIDSMQPDGIGSLYQAYEQLKEKLVKEGLFNRPAKALPRFPQKIAVVTSRSGAVIRDIITTANRRYKNAEVVLFPADVQGENAKYSIVDALTQIKRHESDYDILIIGRGGGSIEDLWPFNEEIVVRKIAEMNLPVISSVGHETDTTLSDLVADVRAATPTAAAEIATPNLSTELLNIQKIQVRLFNAITNQIQQRKLVLRQLVERPLMKNPSRIYQQQMQQVDELNSRSIRAMTNYLNRSRSELILITSKLNGTLLTKEISQYRAKNEYLTKLIFDKIKTVLVDKRHQQSIIVKQLDELSPLKILSRGYVYTTDENDKVITTIKNLSTNDRVALHFVDGQANAEIKYLTEEKRD